MIYQWKNGFPSHGADAGKVARHCEKLRKLNSGKLTPKLVVDDARSTNAPTHVCFQWDDALAAEEFRLAQARTMLRSITVQATKDSEPVTQYVNVQFAEEEERAYTSVHDAVQDPELRRQLLDKAISEVAAWRRKYREYTELSALFDVIDTQLELVA